MASKLNYSQALMQAQLAAITTAVGNAGVCKIYDGTQPSGPATAVSTQHLLASFTMASPFAGTASAAVPSVLSPTLPSQVNGSYNNGGTPVQPTWFRIETSGGTAVLDGSAGTSGCDMTIGPVTYGQAVSITAFTITSGASGH
jgi:hypothetical protein